MGTDREVDEEENSYGNSPSTTSNVSDTQYFRTPSSRIKDFGGITVNVRLDIESTPSKQTDKTTSRLSDPGEEVPKSTCVISPTAEPSNGSCCLVFISIIYS
jgi:hypothetical protein